MKIDIKRELFRHLIASIAYRAEIAVSDAPESFSSFRIGEDIRTPGEILAHLGDLLEGSLFLMKGEFVNLNSAPLAWNDDVTRFFAAAEQLDSYIASGEPLRQPIEKIMQGPISDALTHVGQIIMLRRAAGFPARTEAYFTAEIVPGKFEKVDSESDKDNKSF